MKGSVFILICLTLFGSCNLTPSETDTETHLALYSSGSKALRSYVKTNIPIVLDIYESFGKDVALSDDANTVAVSADMFDNQGAVFVFEWKGNEWEQSR